METTNIHIFYLLIEKSWNTNSMKTSSMSKDDSNLRNSRFGCYFCCGLVNFKDFIILFRNMWVIYGS